MMMASGIVKTTMPTASMIALVRLDSLLEMNFEPGVAADVEGLAQDRVAGADDHGAKHQPHGQLADPLADPVDQAR
jgi:hypothetical protein